MFHVKHINNKMYEILLKLSEKSSKNGDIPVSSIIVLNKKIIGKGYNNRHKKKNVLGHAEINAIIDAEKTLKDWRLNDCLLITTLKPCNMCSEVIKSVRIKKVYYILDQENTSNDLEYEKINIYNEYIDKYKILFNNFFKNMR